MAKSPKAVGDFLEGLRAHIAKKGEDEFAELLVEARALAVDAVERIGRGELQPQDPAKCSYSRDGGCAFPGICRSRP